MSTFQHKFEWLTWFEAHHGRSLWEQIGHAAAIALAFAIPVSTTMTSALAIIILVAWVFGPNRSTKWEILRFHPLLKWVYLLILIAFIGAFYSQAEPKALRHGFSDALRLAIIPILLYFYQSEKIAKAALWAFVSAMILTLVLAYLKVYADFPIGLKFTTGAVFKSHIKTAYFMSMAAFVLALQLKTSKQYRGVLLVCIASMIYYMFFMNLGRIGYITLVGCGGVLAWQTYRVKGLYIAAALGTVLILGAYSFSDIFQQRINVLAHDVSVYQAGEDLLDSSLGSRISFVVNSLTLISEHPLLGYGTGSFGAAYGSLPETAQRLYTDNPHNEFLRMGVEFGALGFLLLVLFFYQQWRLGQQLSPNMKPLWQGVFLTFLLGCFLNSWLKDFTEAYFYCVMTAICFAQLSGKPALTKRQMGLH